MGKYLSWLTPPERLRSRKFPAGRTITPDWGYRTGLPESLESGISPDSGVAAVMAHSSPLP